MKSDAPPLNLLARREYSAAMLSEKLLAKGYNETDIKTVIDDLIQQGIISDIRFIESTIRRLQAGGYGPITYSRTARTRHYRRYD